MRPAPAVVMTPVSMGYMDKVQMLSRITRPMPKGNNYTHYHRARKYKRKADRAWLAGRNADSERLHAKAAHYRKLASITKIVKMLRGPTRFVSLLDEMPYLTLNASWAWYPITARRSSILNSSPV